jgi:hypothetical protein
MIITQSVAQATGYGMVLQDYGDPNANCTLSECAIINAAQIGVSLYTGITPSGIRFTVRPKDKSSLNTGLLLQARIGNTDDSININNDEDRDALWKYFTTDCPKKVGETYDDSCMNDEGQFKYFRNQVPFVLKSKHNINQQFSDHLWIGRDDATNNNVCMTTDCKKNNYFWLSKADGTLITGPYKINHNNPTDGSVPNTNPAEGTYFLSSSTDFSNSENYKYRVGDLLYFGSNGPRSINWNTEMRGFYWCGVNNMYNHPGKSNQVSYNTKCKQFTTKYKRENIYFNVNSTKHYYLQVADKEGDGWPSANFNLCYASNNHCAAEITGYARVGDAASVNNDNGQISHFNAQITARKFTGSSLTYVNTKKNYYDIGKVKQLQCPPGYYCSKLSDGTYDMPIRCGCTKTTSNTESCDFNTAYEFYCPAGSFNRTIVNKTGGYCSAGKINGDLYKATTQKKMCKVSCFLRQSCEQCKS